MSTENSKDNSNKLYEQVIVEEVMKLVFPNRDLLSLTDTEVDELSEAIDDYNLAKIINERKIADNKNEPSMENLFKEFGLDYPK